MFSGKESSGGPALRTYASAYLKKNMSVQARKKKTNKETKLGEKTLTIDNDVMK